MSYHRLAYDDASSSSQMASDAHAVEEALTLPAPSIRYEDYPREVRKPTVDVDEAAARLSRRFYQD